MIMRMYDHNLDAVTLSIVMRQVSVSTQVRKVKARADAPNAMPNET